ncbi:cobalamin biosynthesis protein CbiG [Clostridium botulinum]|nr:cobalt-precorrin 5A hydrolase [Clostridium botulinum]MBO0576455.1 cobalamin biosynthesis protein CbiG [Clostridium botulinum]
MKISVINVTKLGNHIAYKIKKNIDVDLYLKYGREELEDKGDNLRYEDLYYSAGDNLNFQATTLEKEDSSLLNKHSYSKKEDLNSAYKKNCFKKEDFNFKEIVKKSFQFYDAIIFISSTGIAVRAISPFIQSKDKDPAVIVIDSTGKYVISLLSGHLGGANELTEKIAKIIGAEPVITTATDNLNIKAPDIVAKENNLVIEDLKKAKDIAALLVNGQKVTFIDEDGLIDFPKGYVHNIEDAKGIVFVTNKLYVDKTFLNENEQFISENESAYKKENLNSKETVISKYAEENINPINKSVQLTIKHEDLEKQSLDNKCILKLIRKNIVLGIGCRKNYDDITMKENVIKVLKEENIDLKSINSIVSVGIKKDENAIKELSKFLGCPFITYSIEEIKKVEHKFKGSDFVRKTIGVGSVCEPSIELKGGKIIKEKQKLTGMTLAIGKV